MRSVRRLLLAVAVLTLPAAHAVAQMPWPGDPPAQGGGGAAAPWPGTPGAQPMGAPPMSGGMGGGMGGGMSGGGMSGGGMGAPGGGGVPPCMAEFAKLREEVERRGKIAKNAGEHHAARDEVCKNITSFAEAETKWVKYTETNVQNCGIPVQIVNQLKQMHSNTEQAKQRICNAPAAAGPSLSDALGTSRAPDAIKMGNGTLDTLTGPAIH